jgi:hypothetical protein
MANIAWELLTINLILIGIFTGLPYAISFDHHFSRFVSHQKDYKITIKQAKYCHEN